MTHKNQDIVSVYFKKKRRRRRRNSDTDENQKNSLANKATIAPLMWIQQSKELWLWSKWLNASFIWWRDTWTGTPLTSLNTGAATPPVSSLIWCQGVKTSSKWSTASVAVWCKRGRVISVYVWRDRVTRSVRPCVQGVAADGPEACLHLLLLS